MRTVTRTAVAKKLKKNPRLDASGAEGVIDPGRYVVESSALLEVEPWAEMTDAFNPSYQLACITSDYMQLAHEQEEMTGLTERLRLLVKGTKLAEC